MEGKMRCQYSRKRCYSEASFSSSYCALHEEDQPKCRYICPSTSTRCDSALSNGKGFCTTHKLLLDDNRKRYLAFEQKYSGRLPAHKRENEMEFMDGKLNTYVNHARYVDLLSRLDLPYHISNAGIYSIPELSNISDLTTGDLRNRLKEVRTLYQQRAQAVASALKEELKEREENGDKLTIVTNSSAEVAVALQSIINDQQLQIENLPPADKNELLHPKIRKAKPEPDLNLQNEHVSGDENYRNRCQYGELRRNVMSSAIEEYDKEESVDSAVQCTVEFLLDNLALNPDPVAYTYESLCEKSKIQGFNHCFQR
jgi:hypothetical protein